IVHQCLPRYLIRSQHDFGISPAEDEANVLRAGDAESGLDLLSLRDVRRANPRAAVVVRDDQVNRSLGVDQTETVNVIRSGDPEVVRAGDQQRLQNLWRWRLTVESLPPLFREKRGDAGSDGTGHRRTRQRPVTRSGKRGKLR